jgi:hypothetical protein
MRGTAEKVAPSGHPGRTRLRFLEKVGGYQPAAAPSLRGS